MNAELDRRLAELMARAQDGDRDAYRSLLVEVSAQVRSFARSRLRPIDGVEDVVQETLLAIHRDRHTYDPARPFGPWMYAIARHRLYDFADKQRRRSANELKDHPGFEAATARTPPDPADAGFLRRALAQLSQKQREVIQMLKLEDRSVAEIARTTGRTESAVKVSAHRGYKRLRQLLGRQP